MLLNPSLSKYVVQDSLYPYATALVRNGRKTLDENGEKLTLIKSSQYNYHIQQRERLKAEKDRRLLFNWLIGAILTILVTSTAILFLRLKSNRQLLKLHEAEENIKLLTAEISRREESVRKNQKPGILEQRKLFKEQLLDEVKKLVDRKDFSHEQDFLINDPAYSALIEYMERRIAIPEDSMIWNELLDGILRVSPNFNKNLELLLGAPLKVGDLHTAILIKYGVNPAVMADLLGRSKAAICSRREQIGIKIFGEKIPIKEVDTLIKVL